MTDTEFIGDDGLVHCAICGEPKQMEMARPTAISRQAGMTTTFPVQCRCEREATERAMREHDEAQRRAAVEKARAECFPYPSMWDCTFANDDRKNEAVTTLCEKYAGSFQRFREVGAGLLFHGPVGTGKTYHAACIANALIDQGGKALFTSLSTLGGRMQADFGKDKLRILKELTGYDLVVLDDLGIERTTPTMSENVYQVINALYQSGTPTLYTTNNDVALMQKEPEPDRVRIYSRIMECCKPVAVTGADRRRGKAKEKAALFREVLG